MSTSTLDYLDEIRARHIDEIDEAAEAEGRAIQLLNALRPRRRFGELLYLNIEHNTRRAVTIDALGRELVA